MKICLKSAGTPRTSRKVDMMMFREMITMAIIEYDLPYKFVEYKRIRLIIFMLILLISVGVETQHF